MTIVQRWSNISILSSTKTRFLFLMPHVIFAFQMTVVVLLLRIIQLLFVSHIYFSFADFCDCAPFLVLSLRNKKCPTSTVDLLVQLACNCKHIHDNMNITKKKSQAKRY